MVALLVALAISSGVLMAGLGVTLLALRPRRDDGRLFGIFAILWGFEIALFNLYLLPTDDGIAHRLFALALAALVVKVLILVHFVTVFQGRVRGRRWVWTGVAAVYALGAGLALAARPDAFVGEEGHTLASGLVMALPNFAVYYVALHLLADVYLREGGVATRREAGLLVSALAVYGSYLAGAFVPYYLSPDGGNALGPGALLEKSFLALFVAGAASVGWLAVRIVGARRDLEEAGLGWRGALTSTTVPALVGLAAVAPLFVGGQASFLVGPVRFVTVLLLAYGVAKHEFFGLDLSVKRGVRRGTVLGLFLAVFFTFSEGVEVLVSTQSGNVAGLAAAAILALAFRPIERAAGRLADQVLPGVQDTQDYRAARSIEVYRAALEGAGRDGVVTDRERRMLERLRASLGIDEGRATALEHQALGTSQPG